MNERKPNSVEFNVPPAELIRNFASLQADKHNVSMQQREGLLKYAVASFRALDVATDFSNPEVGEISYYFVPNLTRDKQMFISVPREFSETFATILTITAANIFEYYLMDVPNCEEITEEIDLYTDFLVKYSRE